MKKSVLVSCAIAALLLATQAQRLASAQPAPKPVVALLGDSITFGGQWANYFPAQNMLNLGVPGDGTEGMLGRLGQLLVARPPKVFIMAGINDLLRGRTPEDVFGTYRRILDEVEGPGRKVYIESTLYVTQPMWLAVNEKVTALNTSLRRLCEQTRRCSFVDLNPTLAPGGQLLAQFTVDGLHLNQAGYEAWFAQLKARQLLD